MKRLPILAVVAACSSPAAPPVERAEPVEVVAAIDAAAPVAPVDAAIVETDPTPERSLLEDLPPSGEDPLPTDATQAQLDARYALAVKHATSDPPKALALLLDIARAAGGTALDRARWDDAWQAQWDREVFQELVTEPDPEVESVEGEEEEDVGAEPKLRCPKGTKKKGKWEDYSGELWCEKPGKVKHGPYVHREEGYDMDEGVTGSSGEYVDGKQHGIWQWYASFSGSSYGAYVAGKSHGLWVIEERESWSYVVYVHDERQGAARTYNFDDLLIELTTYDQDVAHGPFFERDRYEPYGLETEGSFERGKPHGEWKHYGEGEVLRVIERWDRGVAHGEFVYYDELGKVVARTTMDHGTGDWVAYSTSGRLEAKGRLDQGQKMGAWAERESPWASEWTEGSYANGKRTGTWTVYDDVGGAKRAKGSYDKDVRTGEWTYWHANGTELARGKLVAGKPHGKWELHGEDGAVVQTLQLDKGRLMKLDGRAAKKHEREAFSSESFAAMPSVVEGYEPTDEEW